MQRRSRDWTKSLRCALYGCATTLLLWPSFSNAQASPDPIPLKKGEPAPFAGQLLSTEASIRLGEKAYQCGERTAAEVSKAVRLLELETDNCEKMREIDLDAAEQKLEFAGAARVWYRDPLFVAPVTAVLTVLVLLAARETIIDVR